jgi:hypothetical protein
MQGSLTEIHRELCEASKALSSFHEIEIRKGLQKLRNATLNRASKQQQENALVSTRAIFLYQRKEVLSCLRIHLSELSLFRNLFNPIYLTLFLIYFYAFLSYYNRYQRKISIFI